MKVLNISKNTILGDKIDLANTFIKRFLGLMPRKFLNHGEGLIINPCSSIHMFFMKFAIDVLFVDKNNKIIYIEKCIKPWKVSKTIWKAKFVVELPDGTIENSKTEVGDNIEIN